MPLRGDPFDRAEDPRDSDLFTDRKAECQAFMDALASHRQLMDATDTSPAARNVLTFHGMGGIGKSTLSERLEKWITVGLDPEDHWGAPPLTRVVATARIDLFRSTGKLDLIQAVIAIRQAFAAVQKRWPAFDVAFHAYWTATHPDEELPGMRSKYQDAVEGISDTVIDILGDLDVPGSPIKLGIKGFRTIAAAIKKKKLRTAALKTSDGYAAFLQRIIDEAAKDDPKPELLVALTSFLDYELSTLTAPDRLIVVFIDTFERLRADPRRTDETLLNRLIYGMPNVLFVITGRNELDWYDERATHLPHRGPLRWPNLPPETVGAPRQHPVGKLVHADRLTFIEMACQHYKVDIEPTVAAEIAHASGGLPQYLAIACDVAANVIQHGRGPLTIEHVTGSLGQLVERVLEDIPLDEQRALRAAAVLPFFDAEIVAAAAGVDVGCALRALGRPMIDERQGEIFSYSMHDEIRAALRDAGHSLPGGWSAQDWVTAATAALRIIRIKYENHMEARAVRAALTTLALAITLVCDNVAVVDGVDEDSPYADWLTMAVVRGPSTRALYELVPSSAANAYGQGFVDFILAKSDVLSLDDQCWLLTKLFNSDHPLGRHAGRHRSYVLRNAYRWDDAIASFDEVIARAPSQLHLYQRVLTLVAARRFRDALAAASVLSESRQATIERSCWRAHGVFEAGWFADRRVTIDEMYAEGRHREALEEQGVLYRWRAIIAGDLSVDAINSFRELAEMTGHRSAIRDALLAHAFADPADFLRDPEKLLHLEAIDRGRNSGNRGFRSSLAVAALAWLQSADQQLVSVRDEIDRVAAARSRLWIGTECLLQHVGFTVKPVNAQWLEPYEQTLDRWVGHFEAWRTRVSGRDV